VLGIALVKIWGHTGHTAFALFLAAVILVELFEESDGERAREPMQWDRFRLAAAVQIAAIIMLGPWAGAMVAAAGVLAGGMFRGRPLRSIAFDASAGAIAACLGGLAFEVRRWQRRQASSPPGPCRARRPRARLSDRAGASARRRSRPRGVRAATRGRLGARSVSAPRSRSSRSVIPGT